MQIKQVISIFLCHVVYAKVRILTFHYNQEDFIELQHRCLQRFMQDDYELIVLNDASTADNERRIREMCEKLGIFCVRFEQKWHEIDPFNDQIRTWIRDPEIRHLGWFEDPKVVISNLPSVRHSHVIQYALEHYGYDHDDVVVIMDGDAFFIRELSIKELLKRCDIAGFVQFFDDQISYLWAPFIAFIPKNMPDIRDLKFTISFAENVLLDTGSYSWYYFSAHPQIKWNKIFLNNTDLLRNIAFTELQRRGFSFEEISLMKKMPEFTSMEITLNPAILHYRGISFLDPRRAEKLEALTTFIEKILNNGESNGPFQKF